MLLSRTSKSISTKKQGDSSGHFGDDGELSVRMAGNGQGIFLPYPAASATAERRESMSTLD
jgi:hypothetical protein